MRTRRGLGICSILFGLMLAGCGGGGGGGSLPGHANSSPPNGNGNVRFTFKIPSKAPAATARSLKYISPSTTSFQIQVNTLPAVLIPITCTAPCMQTASISAPFGQDTFTIVASDTNSVPLSQATVTQLVSPGITTIPVTLGGVVATVSTINICPISTPACSLTSQRVPTGSLSQFSVAAFNAKDVDGNTIVGPFDQPLQLTLIEADNSNALQLSKSTLSGPSDQTILSYTGAFDGQNAVAGSIFCTSCAANFSSPSGYATISSICPGNIAVCTTFGMFAAGSGPGSVPGGTSAGSSQGSLARFGGKIWFSDGDFLGTVDATGLISEYPAGNYEGNAFPGPPASVTAGGAHIGPLAGAGANVYFVENLSPPLFGSYNPSAPATGWAEYPASTAGISWGQVSQLALGSDGNLYGADGSGGILGQFITSGGSAANYCLNSNDTPTGLISALGPNIWFTAQTSAPRQMVGFFPVSQNSATCIPSANEFPLPAAITAIGGMTAANGLIWFTALNANGFAEVGTLNPSTHVMKHYPWPATWNGGSSVAPGFITFNPADGFMYFDDTANGIIGRISATAPASAGIQGYGTTFNEGYNVSFVQNGNTLPDAGTFGPDGNLYFDQSATLTGAPIQGATGIGVLNPALALWTASPVKGMGAARVPQRFQLRGFGRSVRPTARRRI